MKIQQDELCRVTISGSAWRRIKDGNWPHDCPRGWEALEAGTKRKAGFGWQLACELRRDDLVDLWCYLESVADALECMTAEERGPDGTSEARACRRAMTAITKATSCQPSQL